ncbi:glucose-fructose oxidoreductase domain-containing protein 2-like [Tropilaelaps mercedesae]|uniref:Glucose-fructose oxidoreductase domain-containing protein 2-like n=1 Tax=Tropilaelaps mercedesae TaxID=418985 RepID=A0A1V9XNM3_9ACAR|nr:glucose-fructose oxidoreductase domain-containing protein 2-like [Tropilaelaps mercedesae]
MESKSLPSVAVFGSGRTVRVVVPHLRSRGFRIEALWARSHELAREAAAELDIPFWTTREDDALLRKNVSLVAILCEPHLHSGIAVKALRIGKHVLCDRPAGLDSADVLKMVQAAQYYPSLISIVGHTLRFLPCFVHMKRQLMEGYVGEVQSVDVRVMCGSLFQDRYSWLQDARAGGGALANFGSHLVDIVSFLTGLRAIRVMGTLRTLEVSKDQFHQAQADDLCAFQMDMHNGALVTVNINTRFAGQYSEELTICGSGGILVVRSGDLFGQKVGSMKEDVLYLDVEDLKQSPSILPRNITDLTKEKLQEKIHPPHLPKAHVKGWIKLIGSLKEAFVAKPNQCQWTKERVQSAATFEEAFYVQSVIDAVRQSSADKQWVRVTAGVNEMHVYERHDASNKLYAGLYRANQGLSL